jgi:tetratricopeptide (TPR) repeat protein
MKGPRMTGPRLVPDPEPAAGCGHLTTTEVESLLEGTLDPDRRARFEAHVGEGCGACALLAADAALFAETSAASGTFTAEERDGAEKDRAAVEAWVASRTRRPRAVRWGTMGLLAAAASVALVLVLVPRGPGEPAPTAFALPLADGSVDSIALLPFSAPGVQRGAEDLTSLWSAAGDDYAKGRFSMAAGRFARIAEKAPEDSDALLYQGVSLAGDHRFAEAVAVLERARDRARRTGTAGPALDWYLAVALAGAGRTAEAIPLLEGIVREAQDLPVAPGETDYGKLASDLLSRLR